MMTTASNAVDVRDPRYKQEVTQKSSLFLIIYHLSSYRLVLLRVTRSLQNILLCASGSAIFPHLCRLSTASD
jgi:hypothetical protein